MSNGKGSFIGQDGLNAPDEPTDVVGTAGNTSVSVAFTAPTDVGASAITGFRAQVAGIGTSGTSSPLVVTGLTNGTSYTANVWAINAFGTSAPSGASASFSPAAPRGIFAGGYTGSGSNVMDYITISSTGDAADFGDLSATRYNHGGCSSATRGISAGGTSTTNVIEYVTIANTGNATDFGDLLAARHSHSGCANSTRGIFAGGNA